MHVHFIIGAVLHATAVAVVGFFVLYAAGKSAGIVKAIGTILGWWLFLIAVAGVVFAVVHPMDGKDMPWMDRMGMHQSDAAPTPAAAPAKPDAAPAQSAPATQPKKP
jgi:hypothetical protein